MKRREFITLLGGAAAASPLAARAQQTAMPVVGFSRHRATVFEYLSIPAGPRRRRLRGGQKRNDRVPLGGNPPDRLPELAADLVRRQVDVIVTTSTPASLAAKAATTELRSSSVLEMIPSSWVWSLASTALVATQLVSIFSSASWRQSGWGCCTSWYPRLPSSPCCTTRIFLKQR